MVAKLWSLFPHHRRCHEKRRQNSCQVVVLEASPVAKSLPCFIPLSLNFRSLLVYYSILRRFREPHFRSEHQIRAASSRKKDGDGAGKSAPDWCFVGSTTTTGHQRLNRFCSWDFWKQQKEGGKQDQFPTSFDIKHETCKPWSQVPSHLKTPHQPGSEVRRRSRVILFLRLKLMCSFLLKHF